MIELKAHEFPRILPLLAGPKQKVVPYAICEGINPGRVFVDVYDNIGFVLLDEDKIVSICTSAFTSSERVEIEVHTADNYRRRGYTSLTASALIEECLRRGKQPNW